MKPCYLVEATRSFKAKKDIQISFNKGDRFYILESSANWWKAQIGELCGLVPSNFVQIITTYEYPPEVQNENNLTIDKPIINETNSEIHTIEHQIKNESTNNGSDTQIINKKNNESINKEEEKEFIKEESYKQGNVKQELANLLDRRNKDPTQTQTQASGQRISKSSTRQSASINREVIKTVGELENRKSEFEKAADAITKKIDERFQQLLEDYYNAMEKAIRLSIGDQQSKIFSIDRALSEEKQRIQSISNIFTEQTLKLEIVRQIRSRQTQLSGVDQSFVLLQARIRGYLARKKTFPLLKNLQLRTKCAMEILQSEQSYHDSLVVLTDIYMKTLDGTSNRIPLEGPICSKESINRLFSNIESILDMSDKLLQRLKERMKVWDQYRCISDIFLEIAPFLKMYIQYVNNYDQALETYERCSKIPIFVSTLSKCQSLQEVKQQDLSSLLIMPIQRVPRYYMLLQKLIELTPSYHKDLPGLQKALQEISKTATAINESKREEENRRKVREISESMGHKCQNLIQPQRRFIFEGDVFTQHLSFCSSTEPELSEELEEVRLFLFNDLLVIASKPKFKPIASTFKKVWGEQEVELLFREQIPILNSTTGTLPPRSETDALFSFFIQYKTFCPDRFYCRTLTQAEDWVRIIRNTIVSQSKKLSTLKIERSEEEDPWLHGRRSILYRSSSSLIQSFPSAPQTPSQTPTKSSNSKLSVQQTHSVPQNIASLFPSPPSTDPTPVVPLIPSQQNVVGPSTLKTLLPIYFEAIKLLNDLFKSPLEIQTILPDYVKSQPPDMLSTLFSRLKLLHAQLAKINHCKGAIENLVGSESAFVQFNNELLSGKPLFFNLFTSIKTNNLNLINDQVKVLVQWYTNMCTLWNRILELPLREAPAK